MPTISQTFEHTLGNYNVVTPVVYNYQKKGEAVSLCKEMSQTFYEDLKSMLEQTELDITFDEVIDYDNNLDCPKFSVFGLEFPIGVMRVNTETYIPMIFRTGEYGITNNLLGVSYTDKSASTTSTMQTTSASLTKAKSQLDLYYMLNIDYNDNLIIASYTTMSGLKFPIFCFIKGVDINDKDVVYISSNCNSFVSPHYHKFVWSESWYKNPYYEMYETPSQATYYVAGNSYNYQNSVFLKLSNAETIAHIVTLDGKIHVSQPICFGGRVTFDNLYTVPDTVNTNAYYTINGETYYCPGDYVVTNQIQTNDTSITNQAMRFLVKL